MRKLFRYLNKHYFQRLRHDLIGHLRKEPARKVDFLICGVQKGGTTVLDAYLRTHPEICMARFKEVHYFDRENLFLYPKPDYSLYHSFFNPTDQHRVLGETTPVYMYWYQAPRRIWEYHPAIKLIIILRNPVERAYSHWNMQRDRGIEPLDFLEALQAEEQRRRDSLPYQNRRFSYLDRGYYAEQIRRMRAFFPEEQFLIFRNRDLRETPLAVLNKICAFLGVSPFEEIRTRTEHARPYTSSLQPDQRESLLEKFTFEIKALEQLTRIDCRDWLAGSQGPTDPPQSASL